MRVHQTPGRIQDLVELKQRGAVVSCRSCFDVIPMDFVMAGDAFQGLMFLCHYSGTVDGAEYGFRKCYARGCTNNKCPNIYQAVMTAHRYAQIDYEKLQQAGIHLERHRLTIEEIVGNFDKIQAEKSTVSVLHDDVAMAESGTDVVIDPVLECISAGERFYDYTIQTVFLMVRFTVARPGGTQHHERCLACYPMDLEAAEKQEKTAMANARLNAFYRTFEKASIRFEPKYF